MKLTKILRQAKFIMIGNAIFYILYNTYFGWNALPINDTELLFDKVSKFAFYFGVFLYILPAFKLYQSAVIWADSVIEKDSKNKKK